jgi:hypothetical protein
VSEATCKTCPFWEPIAVQTTATDKGFCHHVKANIEAEPTRWETWWCSEHPLRQRDRLAAMAMQGLNAAGWTQDMTSGDLADIAYSQADAMLAARKGTP